jgi:hypothetical protein
MNKRQWIIQISYYFFASSFPRTLHIHCSIRTISLFRCWIVFVNLFELLVPQLRKSMSADVPLKRNCLGELLNPPASGSPFMKRSLTLASSYVTDANASMRLWNFISYNPCLVVTFWWSKSWCFAEDKMLFACSDIPLPLGRAALQLTRLLTWARLANAYTMLIEIEMMVILVQKSLTMTR